MAAPGKFQAKGSTYPRWFTPFAALSGLLILASGFAAYDGIAVSHNNPVGYGGALATAVIITALVVVNKKSRIELLANSEGIEQHKGGRTTKIKWSEPHEFYYVAFSDTQTPAVEVARIKTTDGREIDVVDMHIPEQPNI